MSYARESAKHQKKTGGGEKHDKTTTEGKGGYM